MKMRYIDHASGGALQQAFPRLPAPEAAASYLESGPSAHGDNKIPWALYWKSIKKRRWYILALAALLTALAFLYAQSIEPVYRSTATLLIESGKAKILNIEEVYNAVSQDREYYQTQVEILRSRDIALRTVVATKLWDEPEFDPRRTVRSWQGKLKDLVDPPPPQPTWTPERLAEAALGKFLGSIMIEPVRLSQLVKISIEAEAPKLAAKLANAMANSFIVADRETRLNLNVSVTGQLQDRLTALRTKLLQSEQELQKYREQGGLVAMSGSQGIAGQQMSEISQRLVAARVRRTELESAYQQVARLGDGDKSLPALVNSPGLVEAQFRVSAATLALEDVTRNLGDQHSRVIEARNALAAAQQQLQLQTRAVVGGLRRDAQAARETERSLESALAAARTSVQGVNRQEFQLGVLEREVQTNKQLYELFLSRTKETSVSTDLQQAVARVVDAANAATAPLRPNKTQIVLAALLLALSSGSIAAVLLDRMKNTLQGGDDAERRLNVPVLATLPSVRPSETYGLPWAFLDHPKWPHSNAIRSAHTSILLSKYDRSHKLILVTSAVSGEGKTTLCTNLAFAQAQTRRTVLIDCDMRNPQIATQLGLPKDAKGISNLVLGTADVNECVHGVTGSSLLVMPAGDLPATPEEMLLSPQFRSALKSLASRVDIVIIDSAPVLACSDALIIGQQVNDIIYVVKARETPLVMAQRGLQRLTRAGANVLGMVLTGVEAPVGNSKLRRKIPDYGDSQQFDENSVFG